MQEKIYKMGIKDGDKLRLLMTAWKTRSTLLTFFNGFWQQSRTLLRHCCWCGPGFTDTAIRQWRTRLRSLVKANSKAKSLE